MIQVVHRFKYSSQTTQDSEPGKKLVIEHLYVKNTKARVSAELLNGEVVSVSNLA